jgi:hypothetical protein
MLTVGVPEGVEVSTTTTHLVITELFRGVNKVKGDVVACVNVDENKYGDPGIP